MLMTVNEVLKVITNSYIILDLKANNKQDAISEMLIYAESNGLRVNIAKTIDSMFKKEDIITSGLGYGVAFPHLRTKEVKENQLIFAISKSGINYYSLDQKPVHLLNMFLTPLDKSDKYLQLLSLMTKVSKLTMYTVLLLESKTQEEFKSKLSDMIKDIMGGK